MFIIKFFQMKSKLLTVFLIDDVLICNCIYIECIHVCLLSVYIEAFLYIVYEIYS